MPIPPRLLDRKIALLAVHGAHEHEFWVPYYRFREEGAQVIVCGFEEGITYRGEGRDGQNGLDLAVTDRAIEDVEAEEVDALVIPGGIYGPLALRAHEPTLQLVRSMCDAGKVVGAICHAPWVLVSADVLRGKKATSPGDIAVDVQNAGADWVNEPAVRDGNLITSIYFGYLPQFLRLLIEAIEES